MDKPITYVGLDVHKDTIAVALAESKRKLSAAAGVASKQPARFQPKDAVLQLLEAI